MCSGLLELGRWFVRGKLRTLRNNMVSSDFRKKCSKSWLCFEMWGLETRRLGCFILAWEVGQPGENKHEGNKRFQEM